MFLCDTLHQTSRGESVTAALTADSPDILHIFCEIKTQMNTSNVESTLVQVMARCHQSTSYYLSQWWQRSPMLYHMFVTRPQRDHLNCWLVQYCDISLYCNTQLSRYMSWDKNISIGVCICMHKLYYIIYHYSQTKIVDHSDVVGASPAGAAPTTSSFLTWYLTSIDWSKATARRDKKYLKFGICCVLH